MEVKMPRAHQRHNMALDLPLPSLSFFTFDTGKVKAGLTLDLLPSGPNYLSPFSVLTSHRELNALHLSTALTLLSLCLCLECRHSIRHHLLQVLCLAPRLNRTPPPCSLSHPFLAFSPP